MSRVVRGLILPLALIALLTAAAGRSTAQGFAAPPPVYYPPAVSYYYTPPAVSFYTPPAVSYYTPPAVSYYAPPAVSYYAAPAVPYYAAGVPRRNGHDPLRAVRTPPSHRGAVLRSVMRGPGGQAPAMPGRPLGRASRVPGAFRFDAAGAGGSLPNIALHAVGCAPGTHPRIRGFTISARRGPESRRGSPAALITLRTPPPERRPRWSGPSPAAAPPPARCATPTRRPTRPRRRPACSCCRAARAG